MSTIQKFVYLSYITHEKKTILLTALIASAAFYYFKKFQAAIKFDWIIGKTSVVFNPGAVRLRTTILITNKTTESIQLTRISGIVTVNGKVAANIEQTIKQLIRPGINSVELNFQIYLPSIANALENISKTSIQFNGKLVAEGITIPIKYNYEL